MYAALSTAGRFLVRRKRPNRPSLDNALRASWRPLKGDQFSQYAAKTMRTCIKQYQLRPSMSGKGSCFDNAAMESFWKTLKTERVYLQKIYETREIAKADVVAYIEMFYNPVRLHSSLAYRSPKQFEQDYYDSLTKQNRAIKSSTKT